MHGRGRFDTFVISVFHTCDSLLFSTLGFKYFFPCCPQEERQTLEVINNLPRNHASHMKKIYQTMVEAKQNCEAIAFRGHRLLDQVRGVVLGRSEWGNCGN